MNPSQLGRTQSHRLEIPAPNFQRPDHSGHSAACRASLRHPIRFINAPGPPSKACSRLWFQSYSRITCNWTCLVADLQRCRGHTGNTSHFSQLNHSGHPQVQQNPCRTLINTVPEVGILKIRHVTDSFGTRLCGTLSQIHQDS
ncbi:hypothetical protein CRENBAI_003378 [Crenichthys baileyi]|uniref:Uncharacterized protein n=1 Tax=Crenichthys baileyi TaxID=28760 RepID=A0AAV9RVA4_9TELE